MTTILEHGGGLEKYLVETAAELSRRPNVTVDIVTLDDAATDRLTDWQSFYYFKKLDKKLNYKENLADIRRSLGKARYFKEPTIKKLRERLQQYDFVYCRNELMESFTMRFLLHYRRLPPVIFGGHTALYYPNPSSFHARLHNYLYSSRLYRFMAGGAQKFHALNNHEFELYRKLFPKKEVFKIYNPFDVSAFQKIAAKHPFPQRDAFDGTVLNILWAGRLTEQKGVSDLTTIIPAVNECIDAKVRFTWNICGDGDLRQQIEQLVVTQPNVRYFGHVSQRHMASIYQQNNIFLSTSKWEGYPYTLIEPQSFGLQVFAYRIPGVEDILDAYTGGHLANNMDAMIDLLISSIVTYGNATKDTPKSEPSDQFRSEFIYKQLLGLFGAKV